MERYDVSNPEELMRLASSIEHREVLVLVGDEAGIKRRWTLCNYRAEPDGWELWSLGDLVAVSATNFSGMEDNSSAPFDKRYDLRAWAQRVYRLSAKPLVRVGVPVSGFSIVQAVYDGKSLAFVAGPIPAAERLAAAYPGVFKPRADLAFAAIPRQAERYTLPVLRLEVLTAA